MRRSFLAPARIRRAFFLSALAAALTAQGAPPNAATPPKGYVQLGEPDQAEGRKALEAFRQAGIPGEYYFEFMVKLLPRRGSERSIPGRLWGARNDQGAITRVAVMGEGTAERRLLIQNGERPMTWCVDTGGDSTTTRIVDSSEAVLPGVELTAFDLQMPFLYWPDARLERVERVRSRPSHVFLFRPPAAWAAQHPGISGVRAYLDTQYNVPVQTEVLDPKGQVLRTLSLVDLAKVGDQYIPKSIDLRNERTRDKVRFQVVGAALNLALPPSVFEPGRLADDAASPPRSRVQRVAP